MLAELNPWNIWKQAFDLFEQSYSEGIQRNMHEETFAAWMDGCQQWHLFYRDMQNQIMNTLIQQMKIPSKEDIAQVSSLVLQVEEKMETLEDRLNEDVLEQLQSIQETLNQILKMERR